MQIHASDIYSGDFQHLHGVLTIHHPQLPDSNTLLKKIAIVGHVQGQLTFIFSCLRAALQTGMSVGWSVGQLVGWSVGRSVGRSVSQSVGRSVGQSVRRSVGPSFSRSISPLTVRLPDNLSSKLNQKWPNYRGLKAQKANYYRPTDRPTDQPTDRPTDRLTDRPTD